ncbi:hypothetical protein [Aureimonas sp. SK2]|uniref:hypothetical protein n=1 Tax=Aureimonas sp. SK2 TaxID=3015992 RepID=UPI002444BDA7|nr:hypothetical protein [Aureimonas sp. SK2]
MAGPVDHCSLWPDRLFGLDWSACCAAHDASALDLASHLALGSCVGHVWPLMGVAMAAGVIVLGKPYGWLKRKWQARKEPSNRL